MIVADTGPLLRIKSLLASELLLPFAPVVVPQLVAAECARFGVDLSSSVYDVRSQSPPRSALAPVVPHVRAGLIHPAEAEAIAWAIHDRADWLLTDDSSARTVSASMGIEVHGSVGLILRNAQTGFIPLVRARELLGGLRGSNLWVSDRILAEAESLLSRLAEQADVERGASS